MPPERHQHLSKKNIFALLSRPVPFDHGYKVRYATPPKEMDCTERLRERKAGWWRRRGG
uniref:Uncharacterized protein n=2 Tax=Cajanus cajan TaxID=3821 RepID=A0A151R7K4_CAJCA|nr:hypothetical protein KK1_040145 [Cajanus cajan]